MTAADGHAIVFDPAVCYSYREFDIAMTKLFGGFESSFYDGYNAVYPLQNGWHERMDIFNLYPLLVHVNLFGGGYLQQCKMILNRFI